MFIYESNLLSHSSVVVDFGKYTQKFSASTNFRSIL